ADHVIDYTREDFTRAGEKWDIIFDTVGKSAFSRSKRVLKKEGIYLTTVLNIPILFQMLRNSKSGGRKAQIAFTGMRPAAEKKKDLQFLRERVQAGELKAVIDRTFPLEEIAAAHRYVDAGHKKGSVVITLQQSLNNPKPENKYGKDNSD
ncbi:MAG: zinc-binding dehydrogenase, partial [Calditrichia bacterium]